MEIGVEGVGHSCILGVTVSTRLNAQKTPQREIQKQSGAPQNGLGRAAGVAPLEGDATGGEGVNPYSEGQRQYR